MQRLILLRHGKAESTAATGGDFERGLTESGRREAALIGHALARTGCTPDLVLVSTARRAMETWEAAQASFPKARMAPARARYQNRSPWITDEGRTPSKPGSQPRGRRATATSPAWASPWPSPTFRPTPWPA